MIEWTDVEQHVKEAGRNGWRSKEVLFGASGHCVHLTVIGPKYIEAVKSISVRYWQRGL